jgi:hypothetical protein
VRAALRSLPSIPARSDRRLLLRVAAAGALAAAGSAVVAVDAGAQPAERDDVAGTAEARTITVTPTDRIQLETAEGTVADELAAAVTARFELEAVAPPEPEPEPAPAASGTETGGDVAISGPTPLSTWEAVARCESGYGGEPDWTINTGNGYYGGLQFNLDSWRWVGGTGYPHEASKAEQIARAEILLERQGWRAWPACSRALGLR